MRSKKSRAEQLVETIEQCKGDLQIFDDDSFFRYLDASSPNFLAALKNFNAELFSSLESQDGEGLAYAPKEIAGLGGGEFGRRMFFESAIIESAKRQAQRLMGDCSLQVEGIPVAIVSVPVFNAAAIKDPESDLVVILFNAQLFFHLHSFNSLLWRATLADDGMRNEDLRDLGSAFRGLIGSALGAEGGSAARGASAPDIDVARLALSNCRLQALFVLLHEYGHIVRGHLDPAQSERVGAEANDPQLFSQSQSQEFEADQFALELLFGTTARELFRGDREVLTSDTGIAAVMVPLAITFLFAILHSIEVFGAQETNHHPPALDRFEHLVNMMPQNGYDSTHCELMREEFSFFLRFITALQ